jgi:predicted DNA-binding transcriptional regulator YafY
MVSLSSNSIRWGVERRLEFVEFRLFWEGGVNRSDLVDEFGVSVPQASKDLALYQDQAPANMVYDRREKRYFASEDFSPKFIKLDASAYLERLVPEHQLNDDPKFNSFSGLSVEKFPLPLRRIDANVLRKFLAAVRQGQSIEILYQSMNRSRPEPIWRTVSPHSFASDGLRWHARAYCHLDQKFKDFILSRCLDCRGPFRTDESPKTDQLWHSLFSVILVPNPALSVGGQEVVAQDFAMIDGRVAVPVRRAMLYYFTKRLRLDLLSSDPRETPVVVSNRNEFDAALLEASR